MDSFIKKIFSGKGEEELVHLQFQKFSRGEFKDKAVMNYSKGKDKYSLSTTYEYANEFVRAMAEKLGHNKTRTTGAIVTTRDLTGQLNFSGKKQFAGVKQYVMDADMSGKEILELCDKFPAAFFALSMKLQDGSELKIKPKAPISGKPSTKGADAVIKADFCKFYTADKNMIDNFVFDHEINDSVKKAEIKHIFLVNDIIIPPGEKDFAKMRELAKRKGKVIRIINIEGKETRKEHDFTA